MNHQTIGICNICGGPVRAYVGPWMGVQAPPEPSCASCGAVLNARPRLTMTPNHNTPDNQRHARQLLAALAAGFKRRSKANDCDGPDAGEGSC